MRGTRRFQRSSQVFRLVHIISVAKSRYSLRLVRLCVCIMAASTGRSFMSVICGTLGKFVENLQIWFKYVNNAGHFTRRPTFFYIVDSSTRYYVAPQQCKGNTIVACHGFILLTAVRDIMQLHNSAKGTPLLRVMVLYC